ncbi:E3 ubiquitin-protein ligase MARCHF3 isoform X2 [Molossus molossus]|uniref:E3 ubiquitin-protein ligase MARCHF3 isoform X2 n=1 Tax=Molossus molossus TaxID=27622 RepID=UPI0017475BAA|nr:E3 ubiquitin-protein ligase MARCHF3 isoform X2 [Molossus molossus]
MTTSRCSHLPEVLPDCTSSAVPVVKTVEDCGSLVNGQPQYVMQVSAKDGQLLSTVVRTLATQSPFNDRPMCRICHEGSSQEDLLSPCECTGTLGTIHRSCLEHWLSSSNTSYCELCHFRFAVERKPRPLVEVTDCCFGTGLWGGQSGSRRLLPPKQETRLGESGRKSGEGHRFQIRGGSASRTRRRARRVGQTQKGNGMTERLGGLCHLLIRRRLGGEKRVVG